MRRRAGQAAGDVARTAEMAVDARFIVSTSFRRRRWTAASV